MYDLSVHPIAAVKLCAASRVATGTGQARNLFQSFRVVLALMIFGQALKMAVFLLQVRDGGERRRVSRELLPSQL